MALAGAKGLTRHASGFGMDADARRRTRRRQLGVYWLATGKARGKFRSRIDEGGGA